MEEKDGIIVANLRKGNEIIKLEIPSDSELEEEGCTDVMEYYMKKYPPSKTGSKQKGKNQKSKNPDK